MFEPPLSLDGSAKGLAAARAALARPERKRLPAWAALLCAGAMAGAALALVGVVVLGGWEPAGEPESRGVRGALSTR